MKLMDIRKLMLVGARYPHFTECGDGGKDPAMFFEMALIY